MKMDHHFSEYLPAPADLHDLALHISREVAKVSSPSLSRVQRRQLLLHGSALPARAVDLAVNQSVPAMPSKARSFADIVTRLRHLVMPEEQKEARDAFVDALAIEDLEDTAARLSALQRDCPEAVTALLELRIRDAHEAMLDHPEWYQRPACRREIVTAMCHVRLAYWLRSIALDSAARLHRPYGWAPLDTADADDAVRYGPVWQRFDRELKRVTTVIELYDSGRLTSLDEFPCWGANTASSHKQWKDIVLRAHVHEREWRRVHGHDLERILRQRIAHLKGEFADLKARADEQRPTEQTRNMRVANLLGVDPQELLFHAARQVVAWTTVDANTDELVDWLMTPASSRPAFPLPSFHKAQADAAQRAFITLRFALINDDNMLPARLRTHDRSDGSSVHLRSQADALRERGRFFTFDELLAAQTAAPRLEIARRKKPRKHRCLGDLAPPMREALARHLAWLRQGLT